MSKCKKDYGEHDFCIVNTNTKKITCCNCGKEKEPKWELKFEDYLGKIGKKQHLDLGITLSKFNICKLVDKFIGAFNYKVRVKASDGIIQIERIE